MRNEIVLEKKEDMKKRGISSPDNADGLALTFAYPVPDLPGSSTLYAPPVAKMIEAMEGNQGNRRPTGDDYDIWAELG